MSDQHTTAARDPAALRRLRELVQDIDIAMITTVTPDGALRSRPMATREFNDQGEVWFFTADDSGKAADLAAEHAVNLAYADPKRHRYVSVTGNAEIVHDRARVRALWHPMVEAWFPGGPDAPHLALLRVRVTTAEFWDAAASKMVRLLDFARAAATGKPPRSGEHASIDVRATPASG